MGHSKFICIFFYSCSVLGVPLALITGHTSILILLLSSYSDPLHNTRVSQRGSCLDHFLAYT